MLERKIILDGCMRMDWVSIKMIEQQWNGFAKRRRKAHADV